MVISIRCMRTPSQSDPLKLAAPAARSSTVAIAVLLGVHLALTACARPGPEGSSSVPRPNLVLISIDTLRADHVGVYGYDRPTTPNLDALAAGGVFFTQNYAQAPYTAPSQTSILTSLYPAVHGVWEHGHVLDDAVPTLAEILRDAGYATGGFTQLEGESYRRGFDTYERLTPHRNQRRAERNLEAVGGWLDANGDRPWFLLLHFYDVHLPYRPVPEYLERFDDAYDGPLGDEIRRDQIMAINGGSVSIGERDVQHLRAMYDAELAFLDAFLGDVFERLRASGMMESTGIAVVSDHGEEFGEHGSVGTHAHTLYNELIRTPLIVAGPGVPAARRIDSTVRNVDVAPTLLRIAGIEPPSHYQGSDLARVWEGAESESRLAMSQLGSARAFVRDGLKFVTDGSGFSLFDLTNDPLERLDVSADRPDDVATFRDLADEWAAELERSRQSVRQPAEIRLTPSETRRLRALGYIQ